ncbi:hypothetical protein IG631_22310 [Alternaria alternata]|nr:hypothetical protein IG631_22310 [Alternaria alternata]
MEVCVLKIAVMRYARTSLRNAFDGVIESRVVRWGFGGRCRSFMCRNFPAYSMRRTCVSLVRLTADELERA